MLRGIVLINRSAFMWCLQFSVPSFVANEVIEDVKRCKGVVFKLDFKKTYDKVNWPFWIRL